MGNGRLSGAAGIDRSADRKHLAVVEISGFSLLSSTETLHEIAPADFRMMPLSVKNERTSVSECALPGAQIRKPINLALYGL